MGSKGIFNFSVEFEPFYLEFHQWLKRFNLRKNYIYIVGVIFGLLLSCEPNDTLKLPTEALFVFDINRIDNSDDRLTFSRGTITLASFDFEGEREQGEDVYFNQTFSGGLTLPFDPDFYIQELDFDIPQGIYTRIDISFETFDEYDEDNIVVEGIYKNPQEETIPNLIHF